MRHYLKNKRKIIIKNFVNIVRDFFHLQLKIMKCSSDNHTKPDKFFKNTLSQGKNKLQTSYVLYFVLDVLSQK